MSTGNHATTDGNSSSDGSEKRYLGKVPRGNNNNSKTHKKLKRSFGSGFELHELNATADGCPPVILQLGPAHPNASGACCHTAYTGNRSPPGSKGSPGTVSTSRESVGSASSASVVLVGEEELPPEEQWRDGLFGGFCFGGGLCAIGTYCTSCNRGGVESIGSIDPIPTTPINQPNTTTNTNTIGIPSLLCTTSALARVQRALGGRHPAGSMCHQLLAFTTIALLWLSIPAAVYLGAYYPVAGAALLLLCALEATAACRLRGVVRRRFNIDGSACEDGVLSCLFTSCVAAQMLRHLRTTPSSSSAVVTPATGSVRI